MQPPFSLQPSPEPAPASELAREWLVEMIDRTPLEQVSDLPLAWLSREAPQLIADILTDVRAPPGERDERLADGIQARASALAAERARTSDARGLPVELAGLQALLVRTLERDIPERGRAEFAQAVERLARAFGDVQRSAIEGLVGERSGDAPVDDVTGLPGVAQLEEWMRILLAEQRRYGHPFGVAHFEIDGLDRIGQVLGEEAAERIVAAVAAIMRGEIREVDRGFRVAEGRLVVLAPHQVADRLASLGRRLAAAVSKSQSEDPPRAGVAAGIAGCPADGTDGQALLDAAEEAAWAARASGVPVVLAGERAAALQDS